ncbi:hypothetical protein GCM10023318_50040 [Nocardia callitridis]|uniref:Secreted protein n=1 Tax=Nocardia callitridis TaxID=648753 RepID=A0ABP9KRE7_9NOCA
MRGWGLRRVDAVNWVRGVAVRVWSVLWVRGDRRRPVARRALPVRCERTLAVPVVPWVGVHPQTESRAVVVRAVPVRAWQLILRLQPHHRQLWSRIVLW